MKRTSRAVDLTGLEPTIYGRRGHDRIAGDSVTARKTTLSGGTVKKLTILSALLLLVTMVMAYDRIVVVEEAYSET